MDWHQIDYSEAAPFYAASLPPPFDGQFYLLGGLRRIRMGAWTGSKVFIRMGAWSRSKIFGNGHWDFRSSGKTPAPGDADPQGPTVWMPLPDSYSPNRFGPLKPDQTLALALGPLPPFTILMIKVFGFKGMDQWLEARWVDTGAYWETEDLDRIAHNRVQGGALIPVIPVVGAESQIHTSAEEPRPWA